ncbi:hypothetical protein GCM10009789_36040 [Kribbella sancticallisti]|uniref:Enterochelin esterase N-terminal domain-containing protein n=1 Tax=Kribbella sancticallisti TaxID=460087 RepID=A0ABP4PJ01_9ACTN
MSRDELRSPRIERLRTDVAVGVQDATARFWDECAERGAPLVEPIEEEPGFRLVTFVWRDETGCAENVVVFGGPAVWWDIPGNAFEHVPGTDVWYRTYRVRADMRGRYVISPNDPMTPLPREGTPEVTDREKTFRPDPFNPKSLVLPKIAGDPVSVERRFSVLELPDCPPQPWAAPREGVRAGTVRRVQFTSKIFDNTRRVWVHTPHGYEESASSPYGLAVLLDGRIWAEVLPIAPTLDNLLDAERIPPLVTVLVDTLDFRTRARELTLNEDFPRMLAEELLPWVRERWHVTDDPRRTLIQGQSYGGLAAAFTALRIPHLFGNASIHSGSFWWAPVGTAEAETEWVARQYAVADHRPVRFYLEIGLQEGPTMVPTSRHLRDVLEAKGNEVHYREYNGGHDANCWRGGIADALQLLTPTWGHDA